MGKGQTVGGKRKTRHTRGELIKLKQEMTQAKKKSDTVVTLTIVDILLFWGLFLYNILVVKVKKGLFSE